MGLDMYLYCNSRKVCQDMNDADDFMESYDRKAGIAIRWRKSNAIHQWFVDNVQNGNDDCGYYDVEVEDLVKLHDTCRAVLDSTELVDGVVGNGYTFKEGKMSRIEENGRIMADPSLAQELLPTQSGFFFGSTDYDQWYWWDLEYTVEKLGKLLDILKPAGDKIPEKWNVVHPDEPDWYVRLQYHSSW